MIAVYFTTTYKLFLLPRGSIQPVEDPMLNGGLTPALSILFLSAQRELP